MRAAGLALILAWALFAFGAVYPWACLPALAGTALLFLLTRPSLGARGHRLLDTALVAAIGAGVVQLVPLPSGLAPLLSPGAAEYSTRTALLADTRAWAPLSLHPSAWPFGAGLLAGACAFFWLTREAADSSGVRRLIRAIAWMGLVAAVIALVQPALFPDNRVYGFWQPEQQMAHPVGPIISRNHFASWMLLALPLTAGYLIAHAQTHWHGRRTSKVAVILTDSRALWLASAGAFMTAGLVMTQSRSGALGLLVVFGVLLGYGWSALGGRGRLALVGYIGLVLVAVLMWASPENVLGRFEHAWSGVLGGRPDIWEASARLAGQFWLAGVGLGAFEYVMPAFQTTHDVFLNHAHNQYLQIAAEGGIIVTAPLAVAAVAYLMILRQRIADDRTALRHVRIGAAAGLAGLAFQSVWETPFVTPVIALLAAAVAAIAIHAPRPVAREGAA